MPIHDWSRVEAGIFHDFHQAWTIELRNGLNGGVLPSDFFAFVAERIVRIPIPDPITLQRRATADISAQSGGIAVADAPPKARYVRSARVDPYVGKANRIAIRHRLGRVVTVIEIVSPGNKTSQSAIRTFVEKTRELLQAGVNLLIVDLFPPTPRDPQGIHKAIWDQFENEPFELPPDKPLIVAAYSAADPKTAYVEPLGIGDALPSLPLFLDEGMYVPAALEESYELTWSKCPSIVRELVAG